MEPGGSPPPVRTESGTGWVLVCDDTASIRLLMRINLELAVAKPFEPEDLVDLVGDLAVSGRRTPQP